MKIIASSYTQHVTSGLSGSGNGITIFDLDESNGELSRVAEHASQNPGFIALNQSQRLLYTFEEKEAHLQPKLLTFRICESDLTLVNEQLIPGGLPCHLTFLGDKRMIIVACYQTGSIHVYPLSKKGIPNTLSQTIQHVGKSINTERQEGPHAHMIGQYEDKIYVPDLGLDIVKVYQFIDGRLESDHEISLPKGGGPRHIAFHESRNFAFVTNELSGDISLLRKEKDEFQFVKNFTALKEATSDDASLSTIQLLGDCIFVGVRSTNSIATMHFDEARQEIKLRSHADTLGDTPRDFVLSPDGKWLIVGNQDAHSIVIFQVENGHLVFKSKLEGIRSVCCLKVY